MATKQANKKTASKKATNSNTQGFKSESTPAPKGKTNKAAGKETTALGHKSTAEHPNVAKVWQDQCTRWTEFAKKVQAEAKTKRDAAIPEADFCFNKDMTVTIEDKQVGITKFARTALCTKVEYPPTVFDYLADHDRQDTAVELLNEALGVYADRPNLKKRSTSVVCRLRKGRKGEGNGTNEVIRAVVSERYLALGNHHVTEMLSKAFPTGSQDDILASHVFDSGDDIHGNMLIPDYLTIPNDSDYAFGISFSNSEVGRGNFEIRPFLFRSICVNGCIWGRRDAVQIVKIKHLGVSLDLDAITDQVVTCVQSALQHGQDFSDLMQRSKDVAISEPLAVIATLADQFKLNNRQARAWVQGFNAEPYENVFGIVNGLTRGAQDTRVFDAQDRAAMEQLAGTILAPSITADLAAIEKEWASVVALSSKDRAQIRLEKILRDEPEPITVA